MLRATLLCFHVAKKSPEGHEVLPGPARVTRQGNRLELRRSLGDETAEHDATDSCRRAASSHLAGRFPSSGGAVHRPLAADHEVIAGRVEADEVEDERRTRQQLRAQR